MFAKKIETAKQNPQPQQRDTQAHAARRTGQPRRPSIRHVAVLGYN